MKPTAINQVEYVAYYGVLIAMDVVKILGTLLVAGLFGKLMSLFLMPLKMGSCVVGLMPRQIFDWDIY